ncbi:MAG TPA: biopolymer transporter ExbD [Bacteroidetes bacterium]|nr:biopolymer transporter ExbD [Bacteroidota bacterium]
MQTISKRRTDVTVNASSMADIAFLLLIFFLVTTTMEVDKGILIKLPPSQHTPPPPIPSRNIFIVKINYNDELMVRGERTELARLKGKAKEFIMNPEGKDNLPAAPNQAIISIQNDRSTSYQVYISVYNQLKAAYKELWNEAALATYSTGYNKLNRRQQREIRKKIPLVISEGEIVDMKSAGGHH